MAPDDWPPGLRAELEQRTAARSWTRLLGQDAMRGSSGSGSRPGAVPFQPPRPRLSWTYVTGGTAISRDGDGGIATVHYDAGETRELAFAAGESMIHDLENRGDAELIFTTVEYLDSAKRAASARRTAPRPAPDPGGGTARTLYCLRWRATGTGSPSRR